MKPPPQSPVNGHWHFMNHFANNLKMMPIVVDNFQLCTLAFQRIENTGISTRITPSFVRTDITEVGDFHLINPVSVWNNKAANYGRFMRGNNMEEISGDKGTATL